MRLRVPVRMPSVQFRGGLHDPRTATAVGRWLGAALLVCFVTGVLSHVLQEPPARLADRLPSRPVWGYQLTQGLHVASGIAAVPLLLVKLWTVYPRLFVQPPLRGVRHALERLSVAVLVSSALLQLLLGLVNTTQWYPWPFSFREVHWALAWVLTGSLLLHIAVKLPLISGHWRRNSTGTVQLPPDSVPDRRSLLLATGAAVTAVTVVTVGQSLPLLRKATLLAPRRPDLGSQGLPVNRTAAAAQVTQQMVQEWRLTVSGPRGFTMALPGLRAMPQHAVELPIACVEGWSASAHWKGVRMSDLLTRAGAPEDASVRIVSLQRSGAFAVSEMGASYTQDPLTLLAVELNGEPLNLDHGFPARIIAPNRPGVLQTKWVHRIEVLP